MHAHLNGVDLYFDIVSSGLAIDPSGDREKPTLFVQHGGPGADHSYFRPSLDALADAAQIVYIDHRGTGRSGDAPLETYTVEQMADDLDALRRHLGIDKIILLGHSYGGMVAQVYALNYPESLEKLILSNTAPDWGFWKEAQEIANRIATPEQKEIFRDLFEGTISNQTDYQTWKAKCMPLYYRSPNPELFAALSSRARGRYEVATYMMAHELPRFSVVDHLPRVATRTLVLAGAYDWVTPPSQSERIMQQLPNAEYVRFEQSGHQTFADQEQDDYLAVVAKFITE